MGAPKKYLKKTKINIFTFLDKLSLKVFSVKASLYFNGEEKNMLENLFFF